MNVPLLRRLTEAHGVPGQEDAVRAIVKQELGRVCELSVDTMGNMFCLKRATRKPKKGAAKKLMLAAHMDEIGFVVKYIDGSGYLRFSPLGGWDPTMMAAQRVFVHTKSGAVNGLMMPSRKPKHMLKPEEQNRAMTVDDFFIDVGMTKAAAERQVRIGDMVTMNRTLQEMGDLITCKSMDDRAAVYVMIEAMKKASSHEVDVYGVATVQEEIGLRGATAAGSGLKPDICVAIDVTLANDIPGLPEELHVTKLGQGTAIKFLDSSLICHPKLFEHFRRLAVKNKIKHQIELLPMGGTDAGGVQRQHGGIPSFTLSVPTRYIHTVNETIHKKDLQASVDLLAKYIEDAHRGDYTYRV